MRERPATVPPEAEWVEADQEWALGPRDAEGRYHGIVRYWRPDGTPCNECPLVAGKPHGLSRRWHENGELSRTATYEHGELHGLSTWHGTDGATTEKMHAPGMSKDIWRAEVEYVRGAGRVFRFFTRDGRQIEGNGDELRRRPAGVPEDALWNTKHELWIQGGVDEKGRQQGQLARWNARGEQIDDLHFIDDRRDGRCVRHHLGAGPGAAASWRAGKLEGSAEVRRRDGTLARRALHRAGLLHGDVEDFDAAGEPRQTRRFVDGLPEGTADGLAPPLAADELRRLEARESPTTRAGWSHAIARGWGGAANRDAAAARAMRRLVLDGAPEAVRLRLESLWLEVAPRLLTEARVDAVVRALGELPELDPAALAAAFAVMGGPGASLAFAQGGATARDALRARMNKAYLNLGHAGLSRAPRELGWLPGLEDLNLSSNRLADLPPELGDAFALRKLQLQSNRIRELPDELACLGELRTLYLSENALERVPEVVWRLPIDSLSLGNNALAELPDAVGDLAQLDGLWLHDNPLRALPAGLRRCTRLRFLHLGNHGWSEPPPILWDLGSLRELWIASPNLERLPPDVARLEHLERLHMWHSKLREVPEELFAMKTLKEIRIKENPLPPGTIERLQEALPGCTIY